MSSSFTTYYDTLGVTPLASIEEVRRGYRRMAIKTHPDKNPHISKEITSKMFLLVTQAFEFLCDPERKKDYDELIVLSWEQQQYEVTSVATQMELCVYYPMERAKNLLRRFIATFGSEEGSPELGPHEATELEWDGTFQIVPSGSKMKALPCKPRNLQITRDPLPLKLTHYAHSEKHYVHAEKLVIAEETKVKAEPERVIETIRRLSIKTQKSFRNFLEKQGEDALRGNTKEKMYDWERDPEPNSGSSEDIFEDKMEDEEEFKCEDDRIEVGGRRKKTHPK